MPVVLLVHCDGANGSTTFTDVSPSAHTVGVGGAGSVSTTNPKFGTGSAVPYLVAAGPTVDYNFGAGQFTIEAWAYFTAAPTGTQIVMGQMAGTTNLGWD